VKRKVETCVDAFLSSTALFLSRPFSGLKKQEDGDGRGWCATFMVIDGYGKVVGKLRG
jgi:hypothetical protein